MSQENDTRSLARLQNLEVRLYKLTTRSHLRVGAGEGSADVAVENPIIRALIYHEKSRREGEKKEWEEKRVPYIPGSSLHGVIRAWVEKALRSSQDPRSPKVLRNDVKAMDDNLAEQLLDNVRQEVADFLGKEKDDIGDDELYEQWKVYTNPHVCDPLSDIDKCERITLGENESHWKVEWWKQIERKLPCDVCRIFGYMGQRGRIKVTPAWPTTEDVPIDVITRVAINRLTGAADEGKLFDLEAIPPGVEFYFFVVLENMKDNKHDYKTDFEKGIRALHLQLANVGAHSTVGFGMVDIKRVFTATIDRGVFDEDVERFIATTIRQDVEAPVDLDKFPEFFQALVIAAQPEGEKSLLNSKIIIEQGDGNDNQEVTG